MQQIASFPSPAMPKNSGTVPAAPKKRTLRYKPGDLIIKEGDFGTALYRIKSGKVGIFKEAHEEELLLYELGSGDVFGERAFIDGGSAPRPASAVALEAVELEAWHYLALRHEIKALSPIMRLMALNMVKKLARISIVYDRLLIDRPPAQSRAAEPEKEEVTLAVNEPSCMLKLAGGEPVGRVWEGLVEYRRSDDPAADMLHATGVDIDGEGMRFDVKLANINQGGHEPGSSIELAIHLPGGPPVKAQGEITSSSRGSLIGHTALRVRFSDISAGASQRIEAFLATENRHGNGT